MPSVTLLPRRRVSPGVTGNKTINETHDAESPVGIVQIKDGKKQFIGTVNPKCKEVPSSKVRLRLFFPEGWGNASTLHFLKSGGTLMSGSMFSSIFSTQ